VQYQCRFLGHSVQTGDIPIYRRRHRLAKCSISLVEVVGCALEFLCRIGLKLGLGLGLVFRCMWPVDMICKYVCVSECALVTTVSPVKTAESIEMPFRV